MPRYEIHFRATVNATNDAAAARAVQEMRRLLAHPMLTMLLQSSGVDLVSYSVDPTPKKV
jgi:hypothetical protein